MKLTLPVMVVLFALWPVEAGAQPAPPSGARPFRISSRGTAFAVQGEFEGTFTVGRDAVEVFISKATVYVSEHCPYKGGRTIEQINFSLGASTGPAGKWKVDSPAEPMAVGRVMSPGDEYTLNNLYFKIPRAEAADLSARWLVVSIQNDVPDKRTKGFAFASSCKEIFRPAGCLANTER